MFTHDFRGDFEAILRREDPFAFVRFGDGEHAIIEGQSHRSADVWNTHGPVWLQAELTAVLESAADGIYFGLPTHCCLGVATGLRNRVNKDPYHCTYATIFLHGNLRRFGQLMMPVKRFIVGSWYGDIRIPADGVTQPWNVDVVVDQLLEVDRPILVAAGPCANLLIGRYWKRQVPQKRVTILDVGSALDVFFGKNTRYYHDKMHDHACTWIGSGRSSARKPTRRTVAPKATIHIPKRTWLGKR